MGGEFLPAPPPSGKIYQEGDVVLGNDVWIGFGVAILGATVGDGAAIGAYSVGRSVVSPYVITGGNPAQVLRFRFDEGTIQKLLQIKWWDWPDGKVKENVHLICSDSINKFVKKNRMIIFLLFVR